MLVAQNDQQVLIYAMQYSRQELEQLQRDTLFYCPQCQAPVYLKLGSVITPHFAHHVASSCSFLFSEGESEAHLLGKIQLYKWFQKQGVLVMLEPHIEGLSQRPDLFVADGNNKYAIEFQCSTISAKLIRKRTAGYRAARITPIWIFKTPAFAKYNAIMQQRVNKMYQAVSKDYLLFYCPKAQKFTYASHLYRLYNDQFIMRLSELPLAKQHHPFYTPAPLNTKQLRYYADCYRNGLQHLIMNCIRFTKQPQALRLRACATVLKCAIIDFDYSIPIKLHHTLGADIVWQNELKAYCKTQDCDFSAIDSELFLQIYGYAQTAANLRVITFYCEHQAILKTKLLTELFAFKPTQWENKTEL